MKKVSYLLLQKCVKELDLGKDIKIIIVLLILASSTLKVEGSSFEVDLNRKMINHLTDFLSSSHENLEGVLFDLGENSFIVTAIFEAQNFSLFSWVKPALRPGEIFLPANQRTGMVSHSDEKDFVIAVRVEFDLITKSSDIDAVYLKFQQPKVGAYYRQDLSEFQKKQSELGQLLGRYDSAKTSLEKINYKLRSLRSDDLDSQLVLTAEKISIRKKINSVGGQLDALNRQIIRFSGSYLSVLPSDQFLQDTIKSLTGEVSGDSILKEIYLRVNEMNLMHRNLDIRLVDGIRKRSGTIRVGNVGKSLIGVIPGLKIKKFKIGNKATDAHNSSGLLTGNYILSLRADVKKTGRSK